MENLHCTERYEESMNDSNSPSAMKKKTSKANGSSIVSGDKKKSQQQAVTTTGPKRVTIDLDEMSSSHRMNRDLGASTESLDSLDTGQPKRTARDDVLESLGYKPNRLPRPSGAGQGSNAPARNLCHNCGRKVFPMEKIDIGEMYHRGCFKCVVCRLQLTLRTFCRFSTEKGSEVYCKSHVPRIEASYDREAIEIQAAIKAQKKASDKVIKKFEHSPNKYDPEAMEFRHARDLKQRRKVARRKSLKTTADYQKFGVFEAQEELERRQRAEEDKLYHEMNEERKNQIRSLETTLALEKEKTVRELITWFEGCSTSEEERKSGLQKIEQYYREQREQKIKELLDRMHFEEQEAVTRLTEKHAQEMLLMIEERDMEVTEELGRHRPQLSRRLSYKEMQYREDERGSHKSEDELVNVDEEDDDALENVDEEEGDDDYGTPGDDDEKSKDDNDDDINYSKSTDDRETLQARGTHQAEAAEHGQEFYEGRNKDIRFVEKDKPCCFELSNSEASTDRSENLTSRQKGRKEMMTTASTATITSTEAREEEKKREPVIPEDRETMVTEEMHSKKWKKCSERRRFGGKDEDDDNEYNNNEDKSIKTPLRFSAESNNASKPKKRSKSKESTETSRIQQSRVTPVVTVEEGEKEEGGDDDDENEELETIEDSIRKVLKKNNLDISYRSKKEEEEEDKEEEKEGRKKDAARTTLGKPDRNIWRGSKGALNKSPDLSRSSLPEKSQKSCLRKDHLSDKNVSFTSSKERLTSDPSQRSNLSGDASRSDEEYTPRMSVPPSVEPPVCRKSKLYKDPGIFKEFDEHAFEEAKRDPTSFTDLVRRLSYNCKNDLQKVRAIFRWITAKDLNKIEFSKDLNSNTPMGLLRGIKSGTETYHNLFKRLCSYVGIHCKIINGFSKGVGYRPGSKFKDSRFRNQWTAVWIKDSWRFVNCNWGARHVKQQGDQRLTYKIDEFYFLTDPEDHVQQHFPDDPKWQLLRRPVTLDEFVRMPVVKSPFFNNRLEFASRVESVLRASPEGVVELCLRSPALMNFAAKIQSRDRTPAADEELSRRCCIRTVNDLTVFTAVLPRQGCYYWDVFVDRKWTSRSLDNACSFQVRCPQLVGRHEDRSFPQICFGRTPESEAMGLRIEPEFDPLLKVKGEMQVDLDVKVKPGVKTSLSLTYVDHQQRQQDDSQKEVDCSQYAAVVSRTRNALGCLLRCPRKGRYVLKLLAADRKSPSSEGVPVYRFLVDCLGPSATTKPLPRTTSRFRDCRLVEPLDGHLAANSSVCFRLESSSAFEIVVSVNDGWFSLQRVVDGGDGLWQGIVNTGPKVGRLAVFARFREEDEKYVPFVEYSVREPSMADEVHALLKYIG